MLRVTDIKQNLEQAIIGLKKRGIKSPEDLLNHIVELDEQRKKLQTELDELRSKLNTSSRQIGVHMKNKEIDRANEMKEEVGQIKHAMQHIEQNASENSAELQEALIAIPNIPHESVPSGQSDEDNEIHKAHSGELPALADWAKPHWDLAVAHNLIDFAAGTKISGSGFPLFRGKGAKLERALINFFLDEAEAAGYEEIIPPLLVNEASAMGTGQIPDKEGQMYTMERDGLYLIPTAEVPITNIYRDMILNAEDLPVKVCGYTPCFRREAGSYGAHVKGLNRVHQFDKVEIVQITEPDQSYDTLDEMCAHVEGLLQKLELPYRILRLCGGDLGFTSALTFDFEVFSAAQKKWLEVSSVSNFGTFQTNRLKLRIKKSGQKPYLAHSLNGSALALARIVAAILENYQTLDGIEIPQALRPYLKFDVITK